MVISVRISDEEGNLVKAYAARNGLSVSQFLRKAVYDQFDNDYTLTKDEKEVIRELTSYNPQAEI